MRTNLKMEGRPRADGTSRNDSRFTSEILPAVVPLLFLWNLAERERERERGGLWID